jgi:hypothetical protein
MTKWESQMEDFWMFVMFSILLNLIPVLKDNKLAWAAMILFLFGFAAISEWNRRGPMPEQVKALLDRRGIRPIHLWAGVIGIYYAIVGLFDLLT